MKAPFGVSDGAFSIGSPGSEIPVQHVSRSRVLEGLRVGNEERTRREDDPASGQGLRSVEQGQTAERSGTTRSSDDSTDNTMKVMSASPVGNYYIYSFDGKLLQMYDIYGALLKDYIYMGDRLIAEYDYVGARLLYFTPDQINSTRVVTDQSGYVVYSATYAPYGEIRTEQGTVDPLPQFSGKERDVESGLDYFGARYYGRNIFRFISVDPAYTANPVSFNNKMLNSYSYCLNNPNSFVDPNGAYPVDIYVYRMGLLSSGGIWGEVWIEGDFIAYSMEPGWNGNITGSSCIPEGDYDAYIGKFVPPRGRAFQTVKLYHGKDPALESTDPRTLVAFHQGSKTTGCFLIGTSIDKELGTVCGSALQRMMEKINSLGAGLPPAIEFVMEGFDALLSISDFPEIRAHVINTPSFYCSLIALSLIGRI